MFLGWGYSQIALAFLFSVFLNKAQSATSKYERELFLRNFVFSCWLYAQLVDYGCGDFFKFYAL